LKLPEVLSAVVLTIVIAISGCNSRPAENPTELTVIVGETDVHQAPDRASPKLRTLKYGQKALTLAKKPQKSGEWVEVALDEKQKGFVRLSALGAPEIVLLLQSLANSIAGMEPQASGTTTVSTHLRLEPGREGKSLEKLPAGTHFEMFQRQAILLKPADDSGTKPPRKEIWYKVRLDDGRVGYIYSKNFKFEPPAEIAHYAQSRRPMAWKTLRTVTSPDAGSGNDYVVAYATPDSDFGADFNRLEVYAWNRGSYQTAFVVSSLRGILPLRVSRQDGEIFFEIIELDPLNKAQVMVSRYRYAHPYKKVESFPLQQEAGMH